MWHIWFETLGIMLALAFLTWISTFFKRNVSIVDSLWSLLFLAAAFYTTVAAPATSEKGFFLLGLIAAWAVRLSVFLAIRNWGEPEDRRYQAMREKRGKSFAWQSLYIVFLLQAAIAWFVSLPLLGASCAMNAAVSFLVDSSAMSPINKEALLL